MSKSLLMLNSYIFYQNLLGPNYFVYFNRQKSGTSSRCYSAL